MKTRSEAKRARAQEHEKRLQAKREFLIDTPNDPINEQLILAAEFVDPTVRKRCTKLFPADAFYAEEHKAIQAGLIEVDRRNLTPSVETLLRINPEIDIRILEALVESRPELPENLDFHIETLSWDWHRARLTRGSLGQLVEGIQNSKEDPARIRLLAKQVYESFESGATASRFLRDPKEVIRQSMQALRARVSGEAHYPWGIPTLDYYDADAKDSRGRSLAGQRRLRPGAAPGTLSMVTALSGSGKSTLTGHLCLGQARQRKQILFGAWEEEAPVTSELLATLSLKWSRSKVLDGLSNRLIDGNYGSDYEPLNHEELILMEERQHEILKYVTFFDNPFQRGRTRGRDVTNDDHLDIIHDHLAESGANVFFADLWQRCLVDTHPEDERHALYRQLAIAAEQRAHIVIVHQQRAKDIETRIDKRPTREGIIGSGAWLDVCWLVMAPHLPAKWKRVTDDTLELYILKQRNGPWPLCVEFDWNPDTGQIDNGRHVPVQAAETSEEGGAFGPQSKKSRK